MPPTRRKKAVPPHVRNRIGYARITLDPECGRDEASHEHRHDEQEPPDEHAEADDVREQNELLALVVALLANGGEEVDACAPLLDGDVGLAGKVVQVANQRRHDLEETRIRGVA